MPRPHRRGSHSSDMLKPSVSIVQSEHNSDFSERRRRTLPYNLFQGSSNGISSRTPHQQPGFHPVGAYPVQQQQEQQQNSTQLRSVTYSMDLMSTTSRTGHFQGNLFPSPQPQQNIFQSSSHHTSHTAAAGDLLSMSRRAFESTSLNQNSFGGKKRSSTFTEDPRNDMNVDGMSFVGPQHNNLQQHNHFGANVVKTTTTAETPSIYGDRLYEASPTKLINNLSSSTGAYQGGQYEPYQQQRKIRRCHRPDSFEMMEDD